MVDHKKEKKYQKFLKALKLEFQDKPGVLAIEEFHQLIVIFYDESIYKGPFPRGLRFKLLNVKWILRNSEMLMNKLPLEDEARELMNRATKICKQIING